MNPNLQLKPKIAKLGHEITHNFETAYQKYWQELQNKTLDFLAQQQVNDLCFAGMTRHAPAGKDIINKNGSAPTSALTSVPTDVFTSVPKNSTGVLEINSKDPEILFWQIRWKLENDLKI